MTEDRILAINSLKKLEQELINDLLAVRATIQRLTEGDKVTLSVKLAINKYRKARKDAGLTHAQLAEKSGVSVSAIRSIERGNKARQISIDKLNIALKLT